MTVAKNARCKAPAEVRTDGYESDDARTRDLCQAVGAAR